LIGRYSSRLFSAQTHCLGKLAANHRNAPSSCPYSYSYSYSYFYPTPIPVLATPTLIDTPSSSITKIPFAFGDASPKPIASISAGGAIFTVQLIITTPFNGVGAALAIGDATQPDRLMASSRNSPVVVAEYETNPGWVATQDTQILLTITPGAGCTQGSGFILLEIN
jgi:hypothetical protein